MDKGQAAHRPPRAGPSYELGLRSDSRGAETATFSQWNRKRALKPVTWLCGPEAALVSEVLDAYREGTQELPKVSLEAGAGLGDREIWDYILSSPPDGGRRIFVYQAERLRNLDNITLLTQAGWELALTVFISGEEDFTRVEDGQRKVLAPPLAAIQASRLGQLIRCCAPAREEDLMGVVASWWPGAGANVAHQVMSLCHGDLLLAREACGKARLAGLEPNYENADLVCQAVPSRSFTDALVSGERAQAMACVTQVRGLDIGKTLGMLSFRLDTLAAVSAGLSRGKDIAELSVKLKVDRYLLRTYIALAPSYPSSRIRKCRELVAVAETSWQAGASAGILETVVALW